MKIPSLAGTIRRRLLVNFRVDPSVMQVLLPAPFRPKLHDGHAIAGICLIRLEHIRPLGLPAFLGFSSENAAHRVAVVWTDPVGAPREGVYIWRRDTGFWLNRFAGGRLFPGEHHAAKFRVTDDGVAVDLGMEADDRGASLHVRGRESQVMPRKSCFASLAESSRFFEGGSLGYSVSHNAHRLDGLRLKTQEWRVRLFGVDEVRSNIFDNSTQFPAGSAEFDHALVMRDIAHEWIGTEQMKIRDAA
jgi:Uncharacterized conserved protein (COG2071)